LRKGGLLRWEAAAGLPPGWPPLRYDPGVMWITEPIGVLVQLLRRLGGHEYSVR
jgi:hypothetical protein